MNVRALVPLALAAGLAATPLLASAQTITTEQNTGVITSIHGDYFTLSNGTTVRLEPGVQIPPGTSLQPGMRVWVRGVVDDRGLLDADSVSLHPTFTTNRYDAGARYFFNGWYDGSGAFHPYR